jgi:isoleucyl-tRNA synthetase
MKRGSFPACATSVHVETFPKSDDSLDHEESVTTIEEWLKLRSAVYQQGIEPARQAKNIAKSLEAAVTLEVPEARRPASKHSARNWRNSSLSANSTSLRATNRLCG